MISANWLSYFETALTRALGSVITLLRASTQAIAPNAWLTLHSWLPLLRSLQLSKHMCNDSKHF